MLTFFFDEISNATTERCTVWSRSLGKVYQTVEERCTEWSICAQVGISYTQDIHGTIHSIILLKSGAELMKKLRLTVGPFS